MIGLKPLFVTLSLWCHCCYAGFLQHTKGDSFKDIAEEMTTRYPCPNNNFAITMPRQSGCDQSAMKKRYHVTCMPNAKLAFSQNIQIQFPRPLMTGDVITLIGTPTADVVWEMALKRGDVMPLYLVSRFTFQSYRQLALDCYSPQGGWACFANVGTFPYAVNREFNTTILVRQTDFQIYVDGVDMFTFTNRFPSTSLDVMYVAHDVTIKAILLT